MADGGHIVLAVEALVLDGDGDDDARLEVRVALAGAVAGDEVHQAVLQDRLGDVVGLFLRRRPASRRWTCRTSLCFLSATCGAVLVAELGDWRLGDCRRSPSSCRGPSRGRCTSETWLRRRQARHELLERVVAGSAEHELDARVGVVALAEVELLVDDEDLEADARRAQPHELEVGQVVLVDVLVLASTAACRRTWPLRP